MRWKGDFVVSLWGGWIAYCYFDLKLTNMDGIMMKQMQIVNRELLESGYKRMAVSYDVKYVDMEDVDAEIDRFLDENGGKERLSMRRTEVIENGILKVTCECWRSSFGVLIWAEGVRPVHYYWISPQDGIERQFIDMGRRSN